MTASSTTGAAFDHSTGVNAVSWRSGVGRAIFEQLVEERLMVHGTAVLCHLAVGTSTAVFVVRAGHDTA
ncbi:hypothetical protein PM082_024264 [Marasmius tenuissimus]|nr:hypothetical protein PM082_024264 [Marasmius tenuissimus]